MKRKKLPYLHIIVVIVLFLSMCIAQEEPIVESARIDHLKKADIKADGSFSDWRGIDPIYEDSEKSLYCVISTEYLAIRMGYIYLIPESENYFIEIDCDFDEAADYRIELKGEEEKATLEKEGFLGWKEISNELEGAVTGAIEITIPLEFIEGEGFFLTGWVYDTSLENVTAHFPWVRSLYPETAFDPAKMTRNDWKEDFEALYYLVKYNYPYLWVKERTHGFNWLDLKEDYMRRLDEIETNEEFFDLMQEAVCILHNAHTSVLTYRTVKMFSSELPGRFGVGDEVLRASIYWESIAEYFCPEVFFVYRGGEYVAAYTGKLKFYVENWDEKYGIEDGSKVTAINGKDVHEAVKLLVYKTYVWHDCDRDILYVQYLEPNLFGEDTVFTIETPEGETFEKQIRAMPISSEGFSIIFGDSGSDFSLRFRQWEDKKVAYVRVPYFFPSTFEGISALSDFYKSVRDYDALIIDIRSNPGGSDYFWKNNIVAPLATTGLSASFYVAFRQGKYATYRKTRTTSLSKEGISAPQEVQTDNFLLDRLYMSTGTSAGYFNGDIYLLIDKSVYSAAEGFSAFAKATEFAQLVGTTTMGDGLSYTPFLFVLPNSRLVVAMSSGMGINPDGTANEETHTSPDIFVEWSQFENIEELLQYVLEETIGR
jgi:C-terminal processing protease CtpA/Prc